MPGMALVIDVDSKTGRLNVEKMQHSVARLHNTVRQKSAGIRAGFRKIHDGTRQLAAGMSRAFRIAKFALIGLAIASVATGAQFEQSMANVQSVAGATEAELRSMSDTARYWGSQTAFSANEAADAMYSLASAGQSAAQIQRSVGGVLLYAGAAATDLGSAAEATVQALKMFNMEAAETDRVINVMAAGISASMLNASRLKESLSQVGATANAVGMDLEHTVAALGTLHNAGQLGSLAGTRLKRVLTELASPNAALRDLMGDVAFTGDNLAEVMGHIADRGAHVGEVFDAFGKIAGPAALSLMSAGADEMNRMTQAVTGTQKAMEMYQTQMNTVKSQLRIMKSALQENMIAAFMEVKDVLRSALAFGIAKLQEMKPYIVGITRAVSQWVMQNTETIKGWAAVAAKALVAAAAFMVVAKVLAVTKTAFLVLWSVVSIGGTVTMAVAKGFFTLLSFAKTAMSGIVSVTRMAFNKTLAQAAIMRVKMVANWIAVHAAAIGPWLIAAGVIAAAIVAIVLLFRKFRDKIEEWFEGVKTKIKEWLRTVLGWIDKLIPGAGTKIEEFFTDVSEKAKESGGGVAAYFGAAFDEVRERIKGGLEQMKNLGGGSIAMDVDIAGADTSAFVASMGGSMDQLFASWQQQRKLQEERDQAAFQAIANDKKAAMLETVAYEARHTTAWLEAKKALIADQLESEVHAAGENEAKKTEAAIKASEARMQAQLEHDDAVLGHWMANNELKLAGLYSLEAAYDTFFDTILDKEMDMKERREAMWEDMKRTFIRTTAEMFKARFVMLMKNLLVEKATKDDMAAKEKITQAKLGAVKAYQAFASIPIIGPALGAAAAAAAFAFLVAFHKGGLVGSGTNGEFMARMIPGEYVMQPSATSSIGKPALDYMNNYGRIPPSYSSSLSLSFQINAGGQDEESLREWIEDEVVPVIQRGVNARTFKLGTT